MKHVLLVMGLAGLLLAGCGPGGGAVAVAPSETAQPTAAGGTQTSPLPTTAAPEGTSAPPAETPGIPRGRGEDREPDEFTKPIGDAVVVFQRSGGLAGVFERWTIYPDGRVVADDGREGQVEAGQVEQLLGEIEALGFFQMDGAYMPSDTCCDRFTYEITVRSGDRVHTVTTIDAAPNAPQALWQTIDAILRLIMGTPE